MLALGQVWFGWSAVGCSLLLKQVYALFARFKELKNYVLERRDALGGGPPKEPSIMNLDDDDDDSTVQKTSGSKKGFA